MSLPIYNRANLDPARLESISHIALRLTTLEKLIASGAPLLDIRAADEFSLDAIVRTEESLYLVYQMT